MKQKNYDYKYVHCTYIRRLALMKPKDTIETNERTNRNMCVYLFILWHAQTTAATRENESGVFITLINGNYGKWLMCGGGGGGKNSNSCIAIICYGQECSMTNRLLFTANRKWVKTSANSVSVEMQMFNWIMRFLLAAIVFVLLCVCVSKSECWLHSIYSCFRSETDNIIIIWRVFWRFSYSYVDISQQHYSICTHFLWVHFSIHIIFGGWIKKWNMWRGNVKYANAGKSEYPQINPFTNDFIHSRHFTLFGEILW